MQHGLVVGLFAQVRQVQAVRKLAVAGGAFDLGLDLFGDVRRAGRAR
ncbi:MAG: hypothetical protein V9E86_10460 [Nitrosomonas sp.]